VPLNRTTTGSPPTAEAAAPRRLPAGAWTIAAVLLLAVAALLPPRSPASGRARAGARLATQPGPYGSGAVAAPALARSGVVLLAFHTGVAQARQRSIEREAGGLLARALGPREASSRSERARPAPLALETRASQQASVIARLRAHPEVAYAEPDYLLRATARPNDPGFSLQWAPRNRGALVPTENPSEVPGPPSKASPGADDAARLAWKVSTGSRAVVIAETDTGVEYQHPDLAANIWSNPGNVGGCPGHTHGYNVLAAHVMPAACEPLDTDTAYGGHGTHVAGILGAVANNHVGVAGMNWHTRILPVKWLNSAAEGDTANLIEALQWVIAAKQGGVNIRVVNDSATFVGTEASQALVEQIRSLGQHGILFVTAAGNTGQDDGAQMRYPCDYGLANEICVTASDDTDSLPPWANYGAHTVDLAAPGVSIYSTLRGGGYGYLSGGSMAAPQVAGAAALILAVRPSLSPAALKKAILRNVDVLPGLSGRVASGGRLDVCKALPGCAMASISKLRVTPSNHTAGSASSVHAELTYRDSQRARSRITVLELQPGVQGPTGACLPASGAPAPGPACTLTTGVVTLPHRDHRGRNALELPLGKLPRPSSTRYRVEVQPSFAGHKAGVAAATFTVTRR
jgi:subtilisin family serine protease